jgi:hypothetical protein
LIPDKTQDKKDVLKFQDIPMPSSIAELRRSPQGFPDFVIVPKGTHLQCTKIIFRGNGTYSKIKVSGQLLDGEYNKHGSSFK